LYEAIGADRYVLRKSSAAGIQTFAFDGDAFHPAESSSGGPVFFELAGHGSSTICMFDEATHSLRVMVGSELQPAEPALSPDGMKIAFIAPNSLNVAEAGKRAVLTAGAVSNPAFFPDGRQIAFATGLPGRRSIMAIATSGGDVRTLVNFGDCFEPAVSPDGQTLAFTCSATGASHVWVQDLASGSSRRLTNGFCSNGSPAWESDSRSIVFASDCNRGYGLTALYRISVQTARL
jgi:Tol biopolymer transport system component